MSSRRYLRTSDIARAIGVHDNTVRMYEVWGFLQPASRAPNGYRQFTEAHLDQMRLARTALHGTWPGPAIRESALALVRRSASGDRKGALAQARLHLKLVQAEREQAETAARLVEHWAQGAVDDATGKSLQIGEVAKLLGITIDMLRNWERNGLIKTPRDPSSGYRLYGPREIARVKVIRMLRLAGYSVMAILRMLLQLDRGETRDVRAALDTPRPDEDAYLAADRWLSALAEQEQRAKNLVAQLEAMARKRYR